VQHKAETEPRTRVLHLKTQNLGMKKAVQVWKPGSGSVAYKTGTKRLIVECTGDHCRDPGYVDMYL